MIIPFIGLLLSIALGPLLFRRFFDRYESYILGLWSVMSVVLNFKDFSQTKSEILHMLGHEYIPLIVLLMALFCVNNHLHFEVRGALNSTRRALILLLGAFSSNLIGTTGASLLFLKPLVNEKKHTIVFFIFLVSNILVIHLFLWGFYEGLIFFGH
jgi:hypothetical protein